jgi:BASS family bile acid:Na+ symporter
MDLSSIDLTSLMGKGIRYSIMILAFNLGLKLKLKEKLYLVYRPKMVFKSLFAMLIVMPLVALTLCEVFHLNVMAKMAIISASIAPIPATLPQKQINAGGESDYAISLLFIAVMLSIFTIPISMSLISNYYYHFTDVHPLSVLKILVKSVFLPVGLGLLVKIIYPNFANKIKNPIAKGASGLMKFCLVGIVFTAWPIFVSVLESYTLLAIILFCFIGAVIGHFLAGPEKELQTVLSFSCFSRHPGLTIVIGSILFPNDQAVKATVVLLIIVSTITSKIYNDLMKKREKPTEKISGHPV